MQDKIYLNKIAPIDNLKDFKLHLACWNDEYQPLDVFVRSREEWDSWNYWRGSRNEFNRQYIFSFMNFYPETDTWLFGGIYEVLCDKSPDEYKIELCPKWTELIGRLKIKYKRNGRGRAFLLENAYDQLIVSEILKEPYSGERFCGYENINHDFTQLEMIYKTDKPDWKAALSNVKGVYLITDKQNGKKYVGSAYGDTGVWSRWECYMKTGHGYNDDLTRLIKKEGMDYARQNFKLSLLEHRPMKVDDQVIINRETYWKEVLLSRGAFGYNRN